MDFDFLAYKEQDYIIPIQLPNKSEYYSDLINLDNSDTGRADVMFSNQFFKEAVKLIINAIKLFEYGYFDCAFYSLRQSLEITTTTIYFVDDTEEGRTERLKQWKNQDWFPLQNQMLKELAKRKNIFSDLREKMHSYFEEVENVKMKLNKYVHKQGFDKFYTVRNNPFYQKQYPQSKLIDDFEAFLIKSIGAIAVFRLAVDPLPVLLADDNINNRVRELMTDPFTDDFMEKYIGTENIVAYKQTDAYKSFYDFFIVQEEMNSDVLNVVKNYYVDTNKIDDILLQKHLLTNYELVAIILFALSNKIAKVRHGLGIFTYFTNVRSKRLSASFNSETFRDLKDSTSHHNVIYDEVFLSYFKIREEDYFVEHNEILTDAEIELIKEHCK